MSLTKNDFKNIKELTEITVEEKLNEAIETRIATKDDIRHLPTKDEFYNKMDEVMGELKAIREENTVLSGLNKKVNDLDTRVSNIEEKIQIEPSVT